MGGGGGGSNNNGTDQSAHMRSLICAFVICLLKSSISKLVTGEISIFLLVSEVEQTGLSLALSETPKHVLSWRGPVYK